MLPPTTATPATALTQLALPQPQPSSAPAGSALFPSVIEAAGMSGGNPAVLLGLKLAVDVMVVACPCALGLATPTAVLVASSVGARRGLLLRGGDVLERLAAVDVVAFDKTGTLTQGRLRLVGMQAGDGVEEGQVLAWAAAVERSTRHPLADAVMLAARQQQVQVGIWAANSQAACYIAPSSSPVLGAPHMQPETPPAGQHVRHALKALPCCL